MPKTPDQIKALPQYAQLAYWKELAEINQTEYRLLDVEHQMICTALEEALRTFKRNSMWEAATACKKALSARTGILPKAEGK